MNLAERVSKEIGRVLRTYCYVSQTQWIKYIGFIEELNSTKLLVKLKDMLHNKSNATEVTIIYGKGFFPEDAAPRVQENWDTIKEKCLRRLATKRINKHKVNARVTETMFNVGDKSTYRGRK